MAFKFHYHEVLNVIGILHIHSFKENWGMWGGDLSLIQLNILFLKKDLKKSK